MVRLIITTLILALLCACNGGGGSQPQPRPTTAPTQAPQPTEQPTVRPTQPPQALPTPPSVPPPPSAPTPFPEDQQVRIGQVDDLGKAINDAQRPGFKEVVVTASGELKTPVILHPGWRLRLEDGVTVTTRTAEIPIRFREDTSIIGAGINRSKFIESSVPGQWFVFAGFNGSRRNGESDGPVLMQGFEVRGSPERSDFNSTPQAIALMNCRGCKVYEVWINGTHSIGIQLGGAGVLGHSAEDSAVTHCKFTRVASQSLALVNGQRIDLSYNWFEASGQPGGPGSHPIDLEPNNSDEKLRDIFIRYNWLDFRESSVFGNGIQAQGVEHGPRGDDIGNILIEGNVIIGGIVNGPNVSGWCSNGIYVSGAQIKDVTVRSNRVWRTGQAGIHVEGPGMTITDNEFVNVGSGGVPGGRLHNMTGTFARNSLRYVPDSLIDVRLEIRGGNVTLSENSGWTVAQ